MNYCTFSYSARWWDWERWEREIDYMAMRGINMPLSIVGYEAVLFYTLRDLGYTDDGALNFISGPAYLPWQLMGNLDSYFSLTDKAYVDKRLELGKKIIDRELELGMTPIQQGCSGQVPSTILRVLPHTNAYNVPSWCGFPVTYQIDPLDKNFRKFGMALLEKQRQLFGAHHYYACDPFHENKPPIKGDKYLQNVGKAISEMYTAFDSQAVWVMQAWSLREPIVKAVDKDKLLILDIDGSKCEKTDGFWGYNFISGTLNNFGDRNTLHGSIDALAENKFMEERKNIRILSARGFSWRAFFRTRCILTSLPICSREATSRSLIHGSRTTHAAATAVTNHAFSKRSKICMRPATARIARDARLRR